ncbi:hypothetical protein IMG5_122310 [Ichthyophthirius multifiliis]|uniref:Uncharacterized protein n=1 Tax=Ichthyophthirius multifiliis TaxID=5932 RepID=G0QV98_ICHMU|nr:hypothetical protein IMG5_122310 [Ichthyophthirius multifiliis]EGR30856.1 hypothetical protein IMG5_122310 [Ichthyophthirius multifiliis]|eukprot:XP_004032443.1 hypothetical protein IMG5_122310 [Ichthyophthirius multifiliis]
MKIIEEIQQEVDKQIMLIDPNARRKYMKISDSLRKELFDLVYSQNKSPFEAAKILNINYNSVKTILANFKNRNVQKTKKKTQVLKKNIVLVYPNNNQELQYQQIQQIQQKQYWDLIRFHIFRNLLFQQSQIY